MGRGDKRTAKGKRFKGSFGNSRPHKIKKAAIAAPKVATPKKEKPTKKAPAKKTSRKKKAEE